MAEKQPVEESDVSKVIETETRKRKCPPDFEDLEPQYVTIKVVDRTFSIHKELACHYSPVMSAAFNGSFVEGHTQSMTLQDTTKAAFALFVRWIYVETLTDRQDDLPKSQPDLYELALLADKLLIPELQNTAVRAILEVVAYQNVIDPAPGARVYENTLPGSPLRKLLTDMLGICLNEPCFGTGKTITPNHTSPELLFDIIVALRAMNNHTGMPIRRLETIDYMVEVPEDNGEKAAGRKAPSNVE